MHLMKINLSNISVMKHSLSSTPINSRLTTVDWLNLKQTGFPPVRLIGWAHNSTFPIRSPLLPQKTLSSIYPRVPFFNHYSITQTTFLFFRSILLQPYVPFISFSFLRALLPCIRKDRHLKAEAMR